MFERVLNTPMQLYQFHALQLRKRENKPHQYQSVQRFFSEYTYVKHISDSLQLSKKQTNLKSHSLTKNFFRLNIFAIYFLLKLIFFIVHIFSIRTFSLYQTKVIIAFIKKIVDHFYHKCAIEY